MEVDANQVIRQLLERLAELELENAKLKVALNAQEKEVSE